MSSESNLVHMSSSAVAQAALGDVLFDRNAFAHLKDLAQTLANSQLIPAHFRGKWEDVLLGCAMAQTMGESPLPLLQGMHVINGRVGWSSQFMLARVNASGKLRGGIRYREHGTGDDYAVTAYGTLADSGEEVAFTVTVAMAKSEGWWAKNPKWRNLTPLMCRYRSAAFLVRTHFPEVLLGYHDVEELRDSSKRSTEAEAEYEDPSPASLPRSSARPDPGARAAAHAHGGGGVRPSTSETAPALALSDSASPPVALVVPESATFTAVPSGEDAGEPRADEAGSTPRARATSSLSAQAPGEGDSGSPAGPVSDGNPSPAPSHVEASQGHAPAAQGAGPEGRRITRAKLAERQAAARRRRETDEQKAARKAGHDSTWEDAREGFAADLRKIASDMSIDAVSAWCESIGKPTPSRRTPKDRDQLLKALREGKAGQLFLAWADELVDVPQAESAAQKEREAQAEEEGAPVAVEVFASAEVALAWGMDKGAFASIEQARQAYETVKREGQPANAHEMAAMWVAEVQHRVAHGSTP